MGSTQSPRKQRGNVNEYKPVAQKEKPFYPDYELGSGKNIDMYSTKKNVLDGYSKTIDLALQARLKGIMTGEIVIVYFDSFKSLTRNMEKLLYTMNEVLFHGGAFCTANYFIENGHVERRAECLPLTSSKGDMLTPERKRQLLSGRTGAVHQQVLESVIQQLS